MAYASFGKRLGAYLLDLLIVGVPNLIGFAVLNNTLPRKDPEICTIDGDLFLCEPLEPVSVGILIISWVAFFAIVIGWYFGYNEGRRGQTVGKRIVGITVVDKFTHQYIGTGRGIGRYFARILSGMVFCLGYLWMIWDRESETWHDKMVNSSVLDTSMVEHQQRPGSPIS